MNKRILPDPGIVTKLESWSALSAKIVVVAGCIVLAEWAADFSLLKNVFPSHREMEANLALVFVLAGAALLLKRSPAGSAPHTAGQACAVVVTAIGTLTLSQYLLNWDLVIDQMLFNDQIGTTALFTPGRMALSSALNACLLGTALLLLHVESRRGISVAQVLAIPTALISLMSVAEYLYDGESMRITSEFIAMAINTALVFLVLCSAILFAHPRREPMATLASAGVGGFMLRRLFPTMFAILVAAAWMRVAGRKAGLFDTGFGAPLWVAIVASATAAVMWWAAKSLERIDAARMDAEEQLRELNAQLEKRVSERTVLLEAANRELWNEIARHEKAREELRASEERYRFLFDCNPLPLWVVDHETLQFIAVNQAAIEQYGYSREEFLAMTADCIRSADDAARLRAYYEAVPLGHNSKGRWRHLKKDGTLIDVEVFHHVVNLQGVPKSISLAVDITERRKAEEALHDYAARLQTLSQQLLNVQEMERGRIARELHDQIGQMLTGIKLRLQSMRRPVEEDRQAARLEDCIQLTAQVLEQVRTLSLDLRPPLLDELGLVAALESHIKSYAGPAGLFAHFDADELPMHLSKEAASACFRVVQEALTNVIRHAQASHVSVELRWRDGELQLRVTDDGKGFDPDATRRRALAGKSIGLLSMTERMTLIGGQCEIVSAPGSGTSVRAAFPLPDCPIGLDGYGDDA